MLTYLVSYKKIVVYNVKENIFESKRFDVNVNVNVIIIFKEVKT